MKILIYCLTVWLALNAFVVVLRWFLARREGSADRIPGEMGPPFNASSNAGQVGVLRFPSRLKVGDGFVSITSARPPAGCRWPHSSDSDRVRIPVGGAGD